MLSTDELDQLRADALTFLWDVCKVLTPGSQEDAYGAPNPTYSAGSDVACSYIPQSSMEKPAVGMEALVFDARLRLPTGTTLPEGARIRVTHVDGDAVSLPDYDVVGLEHIHATHVVALIKKASA